MFRAAFLATALTAGVASAQTLEIAPLSLDVGVGDALVVAAVAGGQTPTVAGLAPGVERGAVIRAAVRSEAGRPQPSLILGFIEAGEEDAFGIETLLSSTVQEVAFSLDDLAAREALRESDPDLFRQLVEEGHVDPPQDQLARQLQIELARMNCYRSGIDGIWGNGSRGSVTRYFDEVDGVSREDREPTSDLFRTILITGDRDCPVPVAAPARSSSSSSSTTRSTTTRTTTTRSTTTRTAPAPAPAPSTSSTPKLSIGGSGVFR